MFPKRGALATLLTVIALVAILTYQTPSPAPIADTGAIVGTPLADASQIALLKGPAPGTASLDGTPLAVPPGSGTAEPPTPRPAGESTPPGANPPPVVAPPSPPRPTPAPPAPGFTGSILGPVVSLKYGSAQVKAVFTSGRLTDVVTVRCTGERQWACPILRSEALKARSANIDTVSAATYTSDEYKRSLQAAIDKKP